MSKNKFHHTERPPYQRENIDLALRVVLDIMKKLGVDNVDFNPERVIYLDDMGTRAGGFDINSGIITIDYRFGFNTKVHIHEMFHGNSSITAGRSGYHISTIRNTGLWESHYFGFDEGMTQLLTLEAIRENFEDIKALRDKYRSLMIQHRDLWKKSGDPNYADFNIGCYNTGWYRSYFREMRLVNAIIDLVAFERARYGGEIEEHKDDIWTDLVVGYFSGDFQLLRKILKEADSTGRLKKHIEEIQPGDILGKKVTDSIREHIRDIFDSSYRMSAIPKKLD